MKLFSAVVCCGVLLVCVVGCGGGGGSSAIPLDATTRQMQAGDQWEYDVAGSISDATDTVPVTGTLVITVTSETVLTPKGFTARVILRNWNLAGNGRSLILALEDYQTQDPDGTTWSHGGKDGNGVFWVTAPATGFYKSVASPMSQGTSWSADVEYSNGESSDETYTVVGTSTISVPAGRFETYRITGNGAFGGWPALFQDYYSPPSGAYVRSELTAADTSEGITISLAADLTSRNRSLPILSSEAATDLRTWAKAVLEPAK